MLDMRTSESPLHRRSPSHLYAPLPLHELITASSCNSAYTKAYHDLMWPIRACDRHNLEPRAFYSKVVDLQSIEREQANCLVNYGYNSRYLADESQAIDIANDEFHSLSGAATIVVCQDFNDYTLVLGTWRVICGDHLDTFALFDVGERGWSHAQNPARPQKPAEIGRLALHPVFDVAKDGSCEDRVKLLIKFQKRFIVRKLWFEATKLMRSEGVEVIYMVMAPHVKLFMSSAGFRIARVEDARLSSAEKPQELFRQFNRYWNPSTPSRQPRLYVAAWELDPIQ